MMKAVCVTISWLAASMSLLTASAAPQPKTGLSILVPREYSGDELLNVVEVWDGRTRQYRIEFGPANGEPAFRRVISRETYAKTLGALKPELDRLREATKSPEPGCVPAAKVRLLDPRAGFDGSVCERGRNDHERGALVARVINRFKAFLHD